MGLSRPLMQGKLCQVKSSQIYLYSAFHNTDCIKSASQYQSKQLNSVCLLLEKKHPSLVELINGMMGHLILNMPN